MNEVSADEWSETKVVGKANVGGKQKWGGETIRKVKHSSVRIENPIPTLYSIGGWSISVSQRLFGRPGVKAKTIVVRKKTNEADPKGQPHSIYVLRAK